MLSSSSSGPSAALLALSLLGVFAACNNRPSDAELETRRAASQAENARRNGANADAGSAAWTLTIEGATPCTHRELSLAELRALPSVEVRAPNVDRIDRGGPVVVFRGVSVAQLLASCHVEDEGAELTFVSSDAYRSTVQSSDARRAPIALAYERDGRPIPRNEGGPLQLVFPSMDDAEIARHYPSIQWAYYVTHLIVGTEPIRLRVFGSLLDEKALRDLPSVERRVHARYRVGWPDGLTSVRGVRLRDLLRVADAGAAVERRVIVGSKPISGSRGRELALRPGSLESCDPIVVYAYGPADAPVPARLGGPLTLATSEDCPAHESDPFWPTFVESISSGPDESDR